MDWLERSGEDSGDERSGSVASVESWSVRTGLAAPKVLALELLLFSAVFKCFLFHIILADFAKGLVSITVAFCFPRKATRLEPLKQARTLRILSMSNPLGISISTTAATFKRVMPGKPSM